MHDYHIPCYNFLQYLHSRISVSRLTDFGESQTEEQHETQKFWKINCSPA